MREMETNARGKPVHYERPVEAAFFLGTILHSQRARRRILATDEDAVYKPDEDKQDHREYAPRLVAGEYGQGDAHDPESGNGDDRCSLAPDGVGELAEY